MHQLLYMATLAMSFLPIFNKNAVADLPSPEQPLSVATEEASRSHATLPKLDLGFLEVKNLEPTRNQTSRISFGLHLTFSEETDAATIAALEHWQHRLREQVIVAVRVAELGDYLDPELVRLRKQILYRINRLLEGIQAEDVLLADFTYSTE